MSTPKKSSFSKNKKAVCDVCERLFTPFNGDFISVQGKTCNEVSTLLSYACNDDPNLKNVDVDKYVYVVEVNGTTMIKR